MFKKIFTAGENFEKIGAAGENFEENRCAQVKILKEIGAAGENFEGILKSCEGYMSAGHEMLDSLPQD